MSIRQWWSWMWLWGAIELVVPLRLPAQTPKTAAGARQSVAALPALVLDGVAVVDVEHGELVPNQRVVVANHRIQAVGASRSVPLPARATVVDARGKYLIPGLWDLHTHSFTSTEIFYPLFIANGVTGIRDASSPVPLDTLRQWRREILAGARVGPPRQLLSGRALDEQAPPCTREQPFVNKYHMCVTDTADARHLVDSLQAAGVDIIKTYGLQRRVYLAVVTEARRIHMLVGGHLTAGDVSADEASDSGANIIDHLYGGGAAGGVPAICFGRYSSVDGCQELAEHFVRNNTWFTPTRVALLSSCGKRGQATCARFQRYIAAFEHDSIRHDNWLGDTAKTGTLDPAPSDLDGDMQLVRQVGLPILAGTDTREELLESAPPGFSLHLELALSAAEGLTPLEALRTATLNPAKLLHGTDSLGTVAAGKLADLVLLDANPLADVTNTTTIRAVIADGRYYDRAALDQLLVEARAKIRAKRWETGDGPP